MSNAPSKTAEKSTPSNDSDATKDAIDHALDARLAHLNQKILPAAPYILSCPSSLKDDFIKAHYPQNAINWRKHSLLRPGEEELQYLTFKDRSDDGDVRSMFARGGWDDGKGRIAAPEEPYSRTSSDGTPRPGQAPKRKITLAEYKNKDRNKTSTPAPKPVVSQPREEVKSKHEDKVQLETMPGVETVQKQHENHGQKRSVDTMAGTKDPQSLTHNPPSPPTKKARHSVEPSKVTPKIQNTVIPEEPRPATNLDKSEVGDQSGSVPKETTKAYEIPPSDENQVTSKTPQSAKATMPSLPPMLSPLSSLVEEEIAKLTSSAREAKVKAIASKADHMGAPEKPPPTIRKQDSTAPTKGPQEQKGVTSAPRQLAKDTDPKTTTTPKAVSHALSNKSSSISTPKTTPPEAPKKMRLRVRLKIKKKANKKNLFAYLRMPPTPGRNSLFAHRAIDVEDRAAASMSETKTTKKEPVVPKANSVESKSKQSDTPRIGDKRGRAHLDEEEPEPSSKRKHPAKLPRTEKPGTPTSKRTSSPAVSQAGSAQKQTTSAPTPNPQTSSVAMLRAASGQGGSAQTPQQSAVTETPTASSAGRRRRSWTSPDKPKSPNLKSESKDYLKKATDLKHAADRFLKKQEKMTEDERKKGVVFGTESVLCFMFAFTLNDTGLSYSDRTSWNSILPFLSNVQGATAGYSHLEHLSGLLCQLEAIIRDQISYSDMQMLDKNPLKHDFGKIKTDSSISQEQHNAGEYHKCFQAFHHHVMKAQSAWRTGWRRLDVANVPSRYPKTWANRDEHRFAFGKGRDGVQLGEYTRKYNLPLNNMTSGLEAVNFGMVFLKEWTEIQKIDWKPTLIL